jgi:CRP-like cAMP-binding protein
MSFKQYQAGETIFLEGDAALGLWLIEHGRVKIYKLSHAGNEQILHILGEGNSFNDIAALDGGTNPANAAALSIIRLWLLPSHALKDAMLANSRLSIRISSLLAKRVRSLVGQIEDLSLHSVVSRLARFLIRQTQDPSLSGAGVTRTVIAAHLNTTPQTISNALNTLEEAGAIEFDRHQITIVDEAALRSMAEQD